MRLSLPTILLAVGAAVLLIAVAIGERMGDRVIGQATEQTLQSVGPVSVSPSPNASPQPYGPDWKRSQALSAAGDPHFPDPRVPPQPLPTLPPTPKPRPTPVPTPTPIPNVPIWRQKPLPTVPPTVAPVLPATEAPSPQASPPGSTAPAPP
ncbi:MAG: hypothetical protein JO190_07020 [Candidatus Eremiobacteraeota bacterium]|nr:hypothetical protein [Candidatus Eremiobacteraeota bacterium]MBV8497742.1 hypothetical protein [Candidatus Eremiobacteraeota bacterium]